MSEKTFKDLKELKAKAYNVLAELLDCDNEKIRIRAAKLYASKGDNEPACKVSESFDKVKCELLESDDAKVRLDTVTLIIGEKSTSDVKIPSPYELWYEKNYKDKRSSGNKSVCMRRFKHYWFETSGYIPHDSQRLIHDSLKRFIVCICGRRFGKSLLAAKEAEAVLMQPDKRVWIVAPTYALTDKIFRVIYDKLVIEKMVDKEAIVKSSESERLIRLAWGSEVVGKSSDNPDSLLGESVDLLIFDECSKARGRIWEKFLRPTLTDRNGRALFITTPEGMNWVYKLYLRGRDNSSDGGDVPETITPPTRAAQTKRNMSWESFQFPTEVNPYISKDDIVEAKKTLPEEVFDQEYMADFQTFFGKVYKEFSVRTHTF